MKLKSLLNITTFLYIIIGYIHRIGYIQYHYIGYNLTELSYSFVQSEMSILIPFRLTSNYLSDRT